VDRPGGVDLGAMRQEYDRPPLHLDDLDADPLAQCRRWLREAADAGVVEPNAMTLATVDGSGAPSARVVLLKAIDHGLVFFTNYDSRKGRELRADPRAAVVLAWLALHRQVRVEGRCARTDDAANDRYWRSRPADARLTAAASPQSAVITGLSEIRDATAALAEHHPDGDVPRPAHWGGLRLVPHTVELWQGGRHRMHQRFRYRRRHDGWVIEQLAP
jgi:pyridoxamine 5'-phosphate oxidase